MENKTKRTALVLPARCRKNKSLFGVRVESVESIWHFTWSFPLKERTAKNEHLTQNKVSGMVLFDEAYPGCPHCGNSGLIICGNCGKTACIENDAHDFKCPWCGASGRINVTNSVDEIKGGAY